MILSFGDEATRDLFDGSETRAARTLPRTIGPAARRKLDMVNAARDLRDLRVPPGNRLEALRADRKGFYSIRINDQFRVVFQWVEGNARQVQVVDYH